MTTLRYRFKINGTEVEEPTNWDSVEITVMRSDNYHGLENIFSSAMIFWNSGAQLLKDIYDQYGVDGEALLTIEYSCQDTYTTLFSGFLNLSTYIYSEGEVKCNFEDKSISRLFKNRLDTPISLDSNIGLDGQTLSPITSVDLGLHSKIILKLSKWVKPFLNPYTYPDFTATGGSFFFIPIDSENTVSEIVNSQSISVGVIQGAPITFTPQMYGTEEGDYTFNIKLDGTISMFVSNPGGATTYDIRHQIIFLRRNTGGGVIENYTIYDVLYSGIPSEGTINMPFDIDISLPRTIGVDENIYIYHAFNLSGGTWILYDTEYNYNDIDINVTAYTVELPSTAKSYLLFESLSRVCESMMGQNDVLRSQIYGRINSTPYSYPSNGIESWCAITNGLNIRNMLDGDGNKLPITVKFSEIFSTLDALHNIGAQIVTDGSEFRIEIEGKEYFYDKNTVIFSALNVDGLQRSVANDLYFSNISLGSEKWNLNQGQSNGRDEFNAVNNWYAPLKTIKNAFSRLSKYITSGYILEYTRRVQFSDNPTTEYETDNDNFIIATNRATVISDLYSPDGSTQSYTAGTVSERNENFTTVDNVLSPETCYNLRYSPFRRFAYWFKYVCVGIWKTPSVDISFQSGEANYLLKTLMTSTLIDSTSGLHQENEPFNVLAPNQSAFPPYNTAQKTPLFIPEYIDFKYPVIFPKIISILANTKGVIEYSCNNSAVEKGFIKELKFTPNEAGGECNFKLIRAFE